MFLLLIIAQILHHARPPVPGLLHAWHRLDFKDGDGLNRRPSVDQQCRGENTMPYVNVKITTGASRQQKAELIEGITELLVRVLEKNPATTHVVIEEISPENWGISGHSVAELRAAGAPGVSKK